MYLKINYKNKSHKIYEGKKGGLYIKHFGNKIYLNSINNTKHILVGKGKYLGKHQCRMCRKQKDDEMYGFWNISKYKPTIGEIAFYLSNICIKNNTCNINYDKPLIKKGFVFKNEPNRLCNNCMNKLSSKLMYLIGYSFYLKDEEIYTTIVDIQFDHIKLKYNHNLFNYNIDKLLVNNNSNNLLGGTVKFHKQIMYKNTNNKIYESINSDGNSNNNTKKVYTWEEMAMRLAKKNRINSNKYPLNTIVEYSNSSNNISNSSSNISNSSSNISNSSSNSNNNAKLTRQSAKTKTDNRSSYTTKKNSKTQYRKNKGAGVPSSESSNINSNNNDNNINYEEPELIELFIIVKNLNSSNDIITLKLQKHISLLKLKKLIRDSTNIRTFQQEISYNDKVLNPYDNYKSLYHLNIRNLDYITLNIIMNKKKADNSKFYENRTNCIKKLLGII